MRGFQIGVSLALSRCMHWLALLACPRMGYATPFLMGLRLHSCSAHDLSNGSNQGTRHLLTHPKKSMHPLRIPMTLSRLRQLSRMIILYFPRHAVGGSWLQGSTSSTSPYETCKTFPCCFASRRTDSMESLSCSPEIQTLMASASSLQCAMLCNNFDASRSWIHLFPLIGPLCWCVGNLSGPALNWCAHATLRHSCGTWLPLCATFTCQ
jgi:hypothetical protein